MIIEDTLMDSFKDLPFFYGFKKCTFYVESDNIYIYPYLTYII